MPRALLLLLALIPTIAARGQQPTADAIMARVAANQDRADAERAHFVYTQHVHALSRQGKTVRCEETTDTRVTPTPSGSQQLLLKLDGRLLVKKKYVAYDAPPSADPGAKTASEQDDSIHKQEESGELDQDLVENLRRNLLNAKSKDGVAAGLFPLTSKAAPHYTYRLIGRELRNGRDCFHIAFTPKDDNYEWKGDAWIDATAYEPVVVRTALNENIPLGVRVLLGTSLPGLGFTVTYAPQPSKQSTTDPDALWFPSTFGTEFKMNVLFFLHRTVVLDAQNRDFEKTHVSSTILAGPPPATVPQP